MKQIKKRTEITIETHRLLVIDRHNGAFVTECEKCAERVEMVTPDEAAAIVGISSRVIYRAIEAGEVHFVEMPVVFICFNSLLKFINR